MWKMAAWLVGARGGRERRGGGEAGCLVWLIVIWQLLERGELETCWLGVGGGVGGGVLEGGGQWWCWGDVIYAPLHTETSLGVCVCVHTSSMCVCVYITSFFYIQFSLSLDGLSLIFCLPLSSLHLHLSPQSPLFPQCSGCHCTFQWRATFQGLPLIWQCHRDPSSFSHSFHNLILFL